MGRGLRASDAKFAEFGVADGGVGAESQLYRALEIDTEVDVAGVAVDSILDFAERGRDQFRTATA